MIKETLINKKGFTLIELMVAVGILGVLVATSLPLVNAYRTKAEYLDLDLTMKHIMDGLEVCYIENDEFFPETSELGWFEYGTRTVERGEEAELDDILYTFPAGHKHKYVFYYYKFDFGIKYDYSYVRVYADNDYNRNGVNDQYYIYMYMADGQPLAGNYRRMVTIN